MLIEKGANVNAVNENKESPLIFAVLDGNWIFTIIKIIRNWKYQFNITERKNIVELLIKNGANINAFDRFNNPALIVALQEGKHWKDVKKLYARSFFLKKKLYFF